ncbi:MULTISPECIES: hypothetical protein [Streptomyces]|uniref:hypothetical protein n=1 Tax=Streptomyces TaxID=1883 RepID=UPI000E6A09BD|nr:MULTISPECIES: hypothetical protein [Streptomyces]MDX3068961.1 hypothetical protein [Streptomyces sp. ND04-05B]MDX3519442.1 hypothetical protein [Streptomyces scabiei]
MSSTTSALASSPVSTVLRSLSAAGLGAHFDREEGVVIAYPAAVPKANALDGVHVTVQWNTTGRQQKSREAQARFSASAWTPDGPPDFHEVTSVHTTAAPGPLAAEAEVCARAVAAWLAHPASTAGNTLLAALAVHGITPDNGLSVTYGAHSDQISVTVRLGRDTYGTLVVADRAGSLRHVPAQHTGWSVFLHDERGDVVGDPVYITGDGGRVDCAQDSSAAARFIAACLSAPLRHCCCYARESHHPRHDRECSLYALPRPA